MLRKFMPAVGVLILVGLLSFGVLAMQRPNPLSSPPDRSDIETREDDGNEVNELRDDEEDPERTACTADAKICPDGSAVGRVGPNCEFAPCPSVGTTSDETTDGEVVYCDTELTEVCQLNEEPVCGTSEDGSVETYTNSCFACSEEAVVSYVVGACAEE